MEKIRSNTEEFIKKAEEVHKDKYNYSKVNYVNNSTKVTITCPIHGDFEQNPSNHLAGHGCPDCAGYPRYNTESFIKKAKEIYGDEYGYDQVNYVDSVTPVRIYCKKHGYFEQKPVQFLQGYGCPKCGNERKGDYNRGTKEDFVKKAEELYPNNEYGYEKVNYINNHTPVIIIDHLHNDEEFSMIPYVFLAGSQNPKYKGERARQRRSMGTEEFIKRAKEVHGDAYDYSEVKYVNSNTKVKIYCKRCNEYFWQTPINHLRGEGCPHCVSYRSSRGELFISSWLSKKNIEYIHNTRVYGVSGRELDYVSPDFQIKINNISYWIEYNGEQHYNYTISTHFYNNVLEDFEKQLKRDRNVREYCKESNIVLIEIPYTYNTLQKVSDFLTKVLIEDIDPTTLVDYKALYELTEGISLTIDDLLLD